MQKGLRPAEGERSGCWQAALQGAQSSRWRAWGGTEETSLGRLAGQPFSEGPRGGGWPRVKPEGPRGGRQEVASGRDALPASMPPLSHKAPSQGCSGHCALF